MRVADAVGAFAIVIILPEDINITSGSPRYHRNFLDIYLSQISRRYLADLMEYQRILKQRNALLKKLKGSNSVDSKADGQAKQLDIWDQALVVPALKIMAARNSFMEEIKPAVAEISSSISGGADIVDIAYRPRLMPRVDSDIHSAVAILRKERRREVKMGSTLLGPHRDIIDLSITGNPVRSYGSMGQKKTVMIAMKLAALKIVSAHRGEPAILVLDEAFAVLDKERESLLLGKLSGGGQVFLASAVPTDLGIPVNMIELPAVKSKDGGQN
jgi:DNA replication and repair protein RecF